jgi:hypothetical protein
MYSSRAMLSTALQWYGSARGYSTLGKGPAGGLERALCRNWTAFLKSSLNKCIVRSTAPPPPFSLRVSQKRRASDQKLPLSPVGVHVVSHRIFGFDGDERDIPLGIAAKLFQDVQNIQPPPLFQRQIVHQFWHTPLPHCSAGKGALRARLLVF